MGLARDEREDKQHKTLAFRSMKSEGSVERLARDNRKGNIRRNHDKPAFDSMEVRRLWQGESSMMRNHKERVFGSTTERAT